MASAVGSNCRARRSQRPDRAKEHPVNKFAEKDQIIVAEKFSKSRCSHYREPGIALRYGTVRWKLRMGCKNPLCVTSDASLMLKLPLFVKPPVVMYKRVVSSHKLNLNYMAYPDQSFFQALPCDIYLNEMLKVSL